MQIERLALRPWISVPVEAAEIDVSVIELAHRFDIDHEQGFESGLGDYVALAFDLPSGRSCILQEFMPDAAKERGHRTVLVHADAADDQDDVVSAVLSRFELPRSCVRWTPERPFRPYVHYVGIISSSFPLDELARQLNQIVQSGAFATGGHYRYIETNVDGCPVLLEERLDQQPPYLGTHIRCSWSGDPNTLLRPIIDHLRISADAITWPAGVVVPEGQ